MSSRRRHLSAPALVLGLSLGALVLTISPAQASCVAPAGLPASVRGAAAAFVGTVTGTSWEGRRAVVDVDDVWHGHVSRAVVVTGTPGNADTQTTVDRHFVVGTRYLFLPFSGASAQWQDSSCSSTQAYASGLGRFRPSDAHAVSPPVMSPPAAAGEPRSHASRATPPSEGLTVALGAIAVVLAATAWFVWTRRRGQVLSSG